MRAELIAIGSELLLGQVVNSNAAYLSEELSKLGIDVFHHSTVGDNTKRIQEILKTASQRSDLIITTGGLGPTADDISHESISEFLGLEMKFDDEQKKTIERKFNGRNIPEINFKQACKPESAIVIPNPIGTAIGLIFEAEGFTIASFPGVPIEMKAMFETSLKPYLEKNLLNNGSSAVIVSRDIRMVGITESEMAQRIVDLFDTDNPSLAPYASMGECRLRITAKADDEHKARNLIQPLHLKVEQALGEYIYGYDEDTLPGVIAKKLIEGKLTISSAESCTGGLVSKMLTDIPGSSAYTSINFVTYANETKARFLEMDPELIEKHGAVSPEVAQAMSEGLAKVSGSDINLGITGIAGPDGGTEERPVGLVYLGITDNLSGEYKSHVSKLDLSARENLTRAQIRELTAKHCLNKVRKLLA